MNKVPCRQCEALILLTTSEKTGGLCIPCQRGTRTQIEEAKRALAVARALPRSDTTPTRDTRKPVDELTSADLEAFPIWEYVLEEDKYDETYVQPSELDTVPRNSWSVQVAAQYWLPSGQEFFGCVDVSTAEDPPRMLPQFIVVANEAVAMPYPDPPDALPEIDRGIDLARENLPKALGRPMNEILPAKFRLLVLLEGESTYREGGVT